MKLCSRFLLPFRLKLQKSQLLDRTRRLSFEMGTLWRFRLWNGTGTVIISGSACSVLARHAFGGARRQESPQILIISVHSVNVRSGHFRSGYDSNAHTRPVCLVPEWSEPRCLIKLSPVIFSSPDLSNMHWAAPNRWFIHSVICSLGVRTLHSNVKTVFVATFAWSAATDMWHTHTFNTFPQLSFKYAASPWLVIFWRRWPLSACQHRSPSQTTIHDTIVSFQRFAQIRIPVFQRGRESD